MPLEYETIRYEIRSNVAWITLHRPEKLNAFAGEMRDELLQCLLSASEDDRVRCIVITGSGRAFCAGGDLDTMIEFKSEGRDFDAVQPFLEAGAKIVRLLYETGKPVIAMVNGVAAGAGCSLALACDLRVAGESARFAQSFVRVGLHPDWGGTWRLPRLVGPSRALELMWTGRIVEASEAVQIGLVNSVVADHELEAHVSQLATRLAAAPRAAVRLIKLAVYQSGNFDLDGMLDFEFEAQAACWQAADSGEGLRAFAERREPRFH